MTAPAGHVAAISRRTVLGTAAVSIFAASTPALACVTISTEFGISQYRFATAAKKGDLAAMQNLLKNGELKLNENIDWKTWLQWAIIWNKPNMLVSLLNVGAIPDQPDYDGGNAVLDAAGHKSPKWLKMLLAHHANANAKHTSNGYTPLREALFANRDKQFHALIAAKADVNLIADTVGNTPLHLAGLLNKPWHALDLLRAGANPMAVNAQGAMFQRYLFMTNEALLNSSTRKGQKAVRDYLEMTAISSPQLSVRRCVASV